MDLADFDAWIEEASMPEATVALCLDGKLMRLYEEVKTRVEDRAGDSNTDDVRLGGLPRDPEQDELDRLTAEVQAKARVFTLRAMPREKFQELIADHAPRKNPDGSLFHLDARANSNTTTLYPALARLSIVDPPLEGGRWAKLAAKLTDRQIEILATTGWVLNREDREVPFSPSGSPSPLNSATV